MQRELKAGNISEAGASSGLFDTPARESDYLVYMVDSPAGICARSLPTTDEDFKTSRAFNHKELVSVDAVEKTGCNFMTAAVANASTRRPAIRNSSPMGPFLRLSDDSGWLFESKSGRKILKSVPVMDGLWTFYIHNPPHGHCLRWHPVDRDEFRIRLDDPRNKSLPNSEEEEKFALYWPTQKVYCDKRVIHPVTSVNFYRVQGTRGWLFDRKPGYQVPFLLQENQLRKGLFAYRNLKPSPLEVRAWATADDTARTGRIIAPLDVVVADMIVEESHPVSTQGNGPFIHLVDGCGWLFQNKGNEKNILSRVAIEQGYWMFKVLNETGLPVNSQPMIRNENHRVSSYPVFACNSLIKCDRKICVSNGVCFYRVLDTQGWVIDIYDGMPTLELLRNSASPLLPVDPKVKTDGWDPQFVRGIAAVALEGRLEEVDIDERNQMICFSSMKEALINVYYYSRTVGISIDDSKYGRTQVFRKNCTASQLLSIMNDPKNYAERGLQRKKKDGKKYAIMTTSIGSGFLVEEEEEIRNEIVDLRLQVRSLKSKEASSLLSLQTFEALNRNEAKKIKDETELLSKGIKDMILRSDTRDPSPSRHISLSRSPSPERHKIGMIQQPTREEYVSPCRSLSPDRNKIRTIQQATRNEHYCQICRRIFQSEQYLNHHRRDIHGLECNHCFRIFPTLQQLKQHRETEGHW